MSEMKTWHEILCVTSISASRLNLRHIYFIISDALRVSGSDVAFTLRRNIFSEVSWSLQQLRRMQMDLSQRDSGRVGRIYYNWKFS